MDLKGSILYEAHGNLNRLIIILSALLQTFKKKLDRNDWWRLIAIKWTNSFGKVNCSEKISYESVPDLPLQLGVGDWKSYNNEWQTV